MINTEKVEDKDDLKNSHKIEEDKEEYFSPEEIEDDEEEQSQEINIFNVTSGFKLPIFYLEDKEKYQLPESLLNDLEISQNIYKVFIRNTNDISCQTMPLFYNYYTTNINFLKDSQKLIKSIKVTDFKQLVTNKNIDKVYNAWKTIKTEQNFNERYDYLDYERLEKFNHYESFLQIMSIYMLASPILSLLTPLIFLIIPFFILRIRGTAITMTVYMSLLRKIITKIPIGKLLDFPSMTISDKIYALVSASFYFFQIYQNCMYCHRFYKNINHMYENIYLLRDFCESTKNTMIQFMQHTKNLPNYTKFNADLFKNISNLTKMNKELCRVHNIKFSKERIYQTGRVMKEFYKLRNDQTFEDTIHYGLSFLGYLNNLVEIRNSIDSGIVNFCSFKKHDSNSKSSKSVSKSETKIKNSYYMMLDKNKVIKNDVSFSNNKIISGPNATGKTTYVKSTILNVILSQQFGFGFYEKARISPYDYFHCYLNIPDTSGRDSLFQAEVRRCKEILDTIEANKNKRHMCIFDELFSGTNPYEATSVGLAYIEHINNNPNVSFMLTTHYLDLCKHAENIKVKDSIAPIVNINTEKKYEITNGICKKKGGIKVLEEFEYPLSIVSKAKEIISLD